MDGIAEAGGRCNIFLPQKRFLKPDQCVWSDGGRPILRWLAGRAALQPTYGRHGTACKDWLLEVEPELFYDDAFEHKEGKEEAFEEAKEVLAELNKKGQIPPEALLEEEDPMDIEPGVWRRDNQLWTVDEDDEVLGNGKLEIKFPEFFAGEDSPEAKDEARQDFLRLYVRRFLKRGEIRFEEEDPEFQKRKEDAAKRQQKEDAAKQQNKVGVTRIELQEDPLTQSAKARCKNERHITWHKGRRCFQVRLFQGASNLLCFCATFKPESRNLAGVEAALKQAIQARDQFLAKASLTQRRA